MYVCVIHKIMYYMHDMYYDYDYDVLCIMYYVLFKHIKTATPK